jgi:hypothetical protein
LQKILRIWYIGKNGLLLLPMFHMYGFTMAVTTLLKANLMSIKTTERHNPNEN